MAMYPCLSLPSLSFPTLTGSIVTFNAQYAGLPLKACKVNIPVTQEGTGDPSPDNVRNFIGVNSLTIGSIEDNEYKSFFVGIIKGTHGFVDMGTLNWNINTTYKYPFFTAVCDGVVIDPVEGKIVTVASSKYTPFGSTYFSIYGHDDYNLTISKIKGSNSKRLMIQDSNYSDPEVFKDSLSGNYVIYELENADSFNFTDVQFNALCNAFGITGISKTFNFGQTVYGGEYDARTGVLTVTHGYIASYNGEVINEPWISSMDKYVEGGTPTSGAQVVYLLSTPQTIQLPPCPIDTLEGVNNILADTGDTTLQYPKFG
jgi:hypothetical protein